MKNNTKSLLCRGSAFILSAGIPIGAAASYYDFFVQRSDTAISSVALIALILAAVSFKDTMLKYFKSPSAVKVWLVIFVLAYITSRIAEQFVVIAAFGLAAQGLSMPLNMLGDKYKKLNTNQDLAEVLNGYAKQQQ